MKRLTNTVKIFGRDESGATAVEYGLLGALIALSCIVAFTLAGNSLQVLFGSDSEGLKAAVDGATEKISG